MTNAAPIINKCCGIIPNRICLVIFAVFKIVANIFAIAVFEYITVLILFIYNTSILIKTSTLLANLGLIMETAFMIVTIVGACVKCSHLLKVCCHYSIMSLVSAVGSSVVFVIINYTRIYNHGFTNTYNYELTDNEYLLIHVAVILTYALIHILVILLMKSEITKTANIGSVCNDQESAVDTKIRRTSQLSYGRFD